jgi:RNA 3'-terminal phosphate cyclase
MRNLIKTAALLALLGSRVAIAQTVGRSSAGPASPTVASSLARETRLVGGAPIGHRQPHARNVPSENASDLEQPSAEDATVDRKLNICRGC